MEKEFVTYEIGKKLKKLGFEKFCLGFYEYGGRKLVYEWDKRYLYEKTISAPLWQQAIDWFREKHDTELTIDSFEKSIITERSSSKSFILYSGKKFKYSIYKYSPWNIIVTEYIYDNFYKAREQAILKALEFIESI